MNENQVINQNEVMEVATEAMESNRNKGLIVAGVIAGVAVVATVACIVIKKVKQAKDAKNAIEAPSNDYETDEFVEAE